MDGQIVREFPPLTPLIASAFTQLHIARTGDERARAALGPVTELSRPWDPASCSPSLLRELWPWLDQVVGWLNQEYTWQVEKMIPGCWAAHRHIVHEVAVVACMRVQAAHALTAEPLEDWHRYVLPGFLDRMHARLGGSPCPPGAHKRWPGISRHTDYETPAALGARCQLFGRDIRHRIAAPAPRIEVLTDNRTNGHR